MNIQKTHPTFGKIPVMLCEMKKIHSKEKVNATLYLMDIKNKNDLKEIEYGKTSGCLRRDLKTDFYSIHPYRNYYLLKEDSTGEIIACAETSMHYRRTDDKKAGISVMVDEFGENYNYLNPAEPMFAFLANRAIKQYSQNIIIGTSDCDEATLKKTMFTKTKNGEWYMPERRFSQLLDKAEKRYNMVI